MSTRLALLGYRAAAAGGLVSSRKLQGEPARLRPN
jgi:hypothetical protein